MKIVMVIVVLCCAVLGCITPPAESSTEQATSEQEAVLIATQALRDYYNCQEHGACSTAAEPEPVDDFISIDCYIGTWAVACCIEGWGCCSFYWSAGINCYGPG